MAEQNKDVIFGEIIKGQDTKLIVSLRSYKNATYLDLREYWKPEDKDFIPTKKGFTLSVNDTDMVDDLIAALKKAKAHVEKV